MGKSSGSDRKGRTQNSKPSSSIEKYANLEREKNVLYSLYISKRNQLEKEGKDTLLATENEYKRLIQISIEQALIENKIAKDIPFEPEKRNSDPRIIAFRKQAKKLAIKNPQKFFAEPKQYTAANNVSNKLESDYLKEFSKMSNSEKIKAANNLRVNYKKITDKKDKLKIQELAKKLNIKL